LQWSINDAVRSMQLITNALKNLFVE